MVNNNSLFHYTPLFEKLKSILSVGFRFNILQEELPLPGPPPLEQFISYQFEWYAICFCDIPLDLAREHKEQYGSYCIGLTKEWAIKNGVTPIRYVHKNSPDLNDTFKNSFRFLDFAKNHNNSIIKMLADNLKSENQLNNNFNVEDLFNYSSEAKVFLSLIDSYFKDLCNYIIDGSGYWRLYSGLWKDRASGQAVERLFYDEREWRALGREPSPKPLSFVLNDITYIIVNEENERKDIRIIFENKFCLPINNNDSRPKIFLWSELEKGDTSTIR